MLLSSLWFKALLNKSKFDQSFPFRAYIKSWRSGCCLYLLKTCLCCFRVCKINRLLGANQRVPWVSSQCLRCQIDMADSLFHLHAICYIHDLPNKRLVCPKSCTLLSEYAATIYPVHTAVRSDDTKPEVVTDSLFASPGNIGFDPP